MSNLHSVRFQSTLVPERVLHFVVTNGVYHMGPAGTDWDGALVDAHDLAHAVRNGKTPGELFDMMATLHVENKLAEMDWMGESI